MVNLDCPACGEHIWQDDVDAALAAERKATVERIRAALHDRVDFGVFDGDKADLHVTFDAILDAEAAR
jgi:hypothetical protein